MNHIIIDFEMNRIPRRHASECKGLKNEIIEIGAVRLNDNLKIMNRFDMYVMPQYNKRITPVVTDITGITMKTLQGADTFDIALKKFCDWIGEEPTKFYSWSNTDKYQLFGEAELKLKNHSEVTKKFRRWIDLQRIFSRLMGVSHPISLINALGMTKEFFHGMEHSAVDDAENTAYLLMLMKDKERFEKMKTSSVTYNLSTTSTFSLGDVFR